MPVLVIARYRCEVAGQATDSLDYQVKYFDAEAAEEVIERLRAEEPPTYRNADDEEVQWIFDEIVATEPNPELVDGKELIGFITGRPQEMD